VSNPEQKVSASNAGKEKEKKLLGLAKTTVLPLKAPDHVIGTPSAP
jgi:hypothetical protein